MLVSLHVGYPFNPCRYPFNPYTWYVGLTKTQKKRKIKEAVLTEQPLVGYHIGGREVMNRNTRRR